MTAALLLTLAVLVSAALLAALVAQVRGDGYGSRPAPRSHEPWSLDGLPSSSPGRLAT